jgi:hypothetical protein
MVAASFFVLQIIDERIDHVSELKLKIRQNLEFS